MALIEDPAIDVPGLMQHIPGPDFPTAGIINGAAGIYSAYKTGRGRVHIRGRTNVEVINARGKEAIIVTELPYQVNKARLSKASVNCATSPTKTACASLSSSRWVRSAMSC